MPQVLRTEVNTASCGAEFIYILMNEVGDSIPVASTTATVLLSRDTSKVHELGQRQPPIAHPRLVPYIEPRRRTAERTKKWCTPNTRWQIRIAQRPKIE